MPHLPHTLSCNTGHTQKALLSPAKLKEMLVTEFVNTWTECQYM